MNPENSVTGILKLFSRVSQRAVRTSLEKQLDPLGSNCYSRGSLPVFIRKHIATCDFPGGLDQSPSGSTHELCLVFCEFAKYDQMTAFLQSTNWPLTYYNNNYISLETTCKFFFISSKLSFRGFWESIVYCPSCNISNCFKHLLQIYWLHFYQTWPEWSWSEYGLCINCLNGSSSLHNKVNLKTNCKLSFPIP